MASNVSPRHVDPQDRLPDMASRMAKADVHSGVRKTDIDQQMLDYRLKVGRAIAVVVKRVGSLKEFAALIDRDEREVARWISAERRPHLDAVFAVPILRRPMVIALAAELASDCVEIETVIRVRMVA
jgi:hypothetical protein